MYGSGLPPSRKRYSYNSNRIGSAIVRRTLLDSIQSKLSSECRNQIGPTVVVLLGMGGAGKSLLALQCCREMEQRVNAIFWVDATSPKMVRQSFVNILKDVTGFEEELGNDSFSGTSRQPLDMKALVSRMKILLLERYDNKWLLVFDNFDDLLSFGNDVLSDFWPVSEHGFVLVTSRNEAAKLLGDTVEVSVLSEIEATDLLLQRCKCAQNEENRKLAYNVGELLGFLALAVDQAAAYIATNHLTLSQFPDLFRQKRKKVLAKIPEASIWHYRRKLKDSELETTLSVFTTWDTSFLSIQGGSEGERVAKQRVLTLSAFLDHDCLSSQVFDPYFEINFPKSEEIVDTNFFADADEIDLEETLIELRNLSLLQTLQRHDNGRYSYSLHRLIKDWAKLRLLPEDQREYTIEATNLLARFLPARRVGKYLEMSDTWTRQLNSHIDVSLRNCHEFLKAEELPGVGPLYEAGMKIVGFYVRQKKQRMAIPICARALADREKNYPDTDEETLDIITRLSACHGQVYEFEPAGLLAKRALMASRSLSPDSYSRGLALICTGELYRKDGFFQKAIKFLEEGIVVMRKYYETNLHFETNPQPILNAMSQLSGVFYDREQYDLALLHAQQVIDGNLSLNGSSHPNTIESQQFIIRLHIDTGNYALAESLLSDVKLLVKSFYEENHWLSVRTKHLSAILIGRQNKHDEAERLIQALVDECAIRYGPTDAITLDYLIDLGYQQYCGKNYRLAVKTFERGIERCDASNPISICKPKMQMMLSMTFNQLGLYEEARSINEQVLMSIENQNYNDRERAVWCIYFEYCKEKKFDREPSSIKQSLDRAIETTEKHFGFDYPAGRKKLSYALTGYFYLADAEKLDLYSGKLLNSIYLTIKLKHTTNNKEAVEAASYPLPTDQGSLVNHTRQLEEVENILQQELKAQKETQGRINLRKLFLKIHLAKTLRKQGRLDEAHTLLNHVVMTFRGHESDEHHSHIIYAEAELAKLLFENGKFKEAAFTFAQILRQCRERRSESMLTIYDAYLPDIIITCKDKHPRKLETFLLALLADFEKTCDTSQTWRALILNELGKTYTDLEEDEKAENSYRQALALFDVHLESTNVIRLCTLHALANALRKRSRFQESESTLKSTLENRVLLLGPEHWDTIHTKFGFCLLYEVQARYTEAEKYCQTAIDERIKTSYFADDIFTMIYKHTLANIFKCLLRPDEAEAVIREVITWRKRELGPKNLDTLSSQLLLGQILQQMERYKEAEEIFRIVYEGRKAALGADGSLTLATLRDLGLVMEAENLLMDAEAVFREALGTCQNARVCKQSDLVWIIFHLARTLWRQKRLAEAEREFRACLELEKRTVGEGHGDTMVTISLIGHCLREQNKFAEAEPFYRQVYDHKCITVGPKGGETLDYLFLTAVMIMNEPEKLSMAEERFAECAQLREEVLGSEHNLTLATRYQLARVYKYQGRLQEAQKALDSLLNILLSTTPYLGNEFLEQALQNHGEVLWLVGHRDEAQIPYRRLLALYLNFSNIPRELEIVIRAGVRKLHVAASLIQYGQANSATAPSDANAHATSEALRLTSSATSADHLTGPRFCDSCSWATQEATEIVGAIYHCLDCSDFDLCGSCFTKLRSPSSATSEAMTHVPANYRTCVREHEFLCTDDYAVSGDDEAQDAAVVAEGGSKNWQVEMTNEVFAKLSCEDEIGVRWIERLQER